jgi:hypothetical protein
VRVPAGQFVTARVHDRELSFTLAQPGAHWVMNALAVLAAADAIGGDLGLAGLALAELNGMPGRGERVLVSAPGGEALVIDESYNANPASVRATLAVLAEEPGRRIAVLGEMRELGHQSGVLHAELAEPVIAARAEVIFLVGEAMTPLARALEPEVNVVHVPTRRPRPSDCGPSCARATRCWSKVQTGWGCRGWSRRSGMGLRRCCSGSRSNSAFRACSTSSATRASAPARRSRRRSPSVC